MRKQIYGCNHKGIYKSDWLVHGYYILFNNEIF